MQLLDKLASVWMWGALFASVCVLSSVGFNVLWLW